MRIKKELIPTDKLKVISVKQIDEIINHLLELLKVSLDYVKLPNYISSFNLKECDCERVINSFSTLMRGLRGFILLVLHKQRVNIKSFMLSLDDENRDNELYTL